MSRNPCPTCGGSGQRKRVVNPDWPNGDLHHVELTDEDCPDCLGTGKEIPKDCCESMTQAIEDKLIQVQSITGDYILSSEHGTITTELHYCPWCQARFAGSLSL